MGSRRIVLLIAAVAVALPVVAAVAGLSLRAEADAADRCMYLLFLPCTVMGIDMWQLPFNLAEVVIRYPSILPMVAVLPVSVVLLMLDVRLARRVNRHAP